MKHTITHVGSYSSADPANDYGIVALPDGLGQFYLGAERSASWQRIRPGYTQITLSERVDGREVKHDGWIEQGEKADGICTAWMVEHRIAPPFQPVDRTLQKRG